MTAPLTDHALVVHAFGPVDAYDKLLTVWKSCADGLGMTSPIPPLGLPADLPTGLPPGGALAARQTPDQRFQAIVRRNQDTLILSAALSGDDWSALEPLWISAAAQDWSFGETRIYAAAGRDPGDAVPRLGPSAAVGGHTLVWEASGTPDDRPLRLVVALSRQGRSAESDAWLWSRGDDRLPPFARYLLHTAKIRYQLRVRERYDQEVHVGSVARDTDDLAAEARRILVSDRPALPDLLAIRARLAAQMVQSTGLVGVRTRITEMSRTVEIAVANSRAPSRRGLFADDRALAEWFAHRLADDTHYLDAAAERVRDVLSALSMAIEATLDQRREEFRAEDSAAAQRRERLNLLQTAVIGSALMVLAAVQAFQYRLPLPPSLQAPVIAVLGATTLLLATVALWTRSGHPAPVWTGRFACGLTCAALGWLGTTLTTHLTTGHPAPVSAALSLSAAAFVLGLLAALKLLPRPV
ncbi:CATRA conflict system CASPASE/TPR repeat-associated protein [Streptosporangium subroseum]|uniref:CATRA conflict system CASPASE/TPR repeat-associated protein n=1 Tax=Streptosporangium subroseum TaxID=106412 RepID=UPI00308A5416|nr:BN6_48550 family protein [Streptosporangium subroseum]